MAPAGSAGAIGTALRPKAAGSREVDPLSRDPVLQPAGAAADHVVVMLLAPPVRLLEEQLRVQLRPSGRIAVLQLLLDKDGLARQRVRIVGEVVLGALDHQT